MKRNLKKLFCLVLSLIVVICNVPLVNAADLSSDDKAKVNETDETLELLGSTSVTIGGGSEPLELLVAANGSMGVFISEYSPTVQFYGGYSYGTVWHVNGVEYSTYYLSSGKFASSYCSIDDSFLGTLGLGDIALQDGGRTARVEWNVDGITFIYYVTLLENARSIQQKWEIINNTGSPLSDVKMISGGDTYFSGNDYGYSYWNESEQMAYIVKDETSGMMSYTADTTTPCDKHFVGRYSVGYDQAVIGDLDNSVSSSLLDQSYYLQWNYGTIAAGETATTKAQQEWSISGYVMITAPTGQTVMPDTTVSYVFTLVNVSPNAATVSNLTAISSQGYMTNIPGGTIVTVPGDGSKTVTVEVKIPSSAANGSVDSLTLSADYSVASATGSISTSVNTTIEGELTHKPYIDGYPDGTFRPDNPIIRAETAQMLYNLFGTYSSAYSGSFHDVSSSIWYYDAVMSMNETSVIEGYSDGTFRPENDISRAEFVAMVTRLLGLTATGNSSFTDVPSTHWAASSIAAAEEAGLVEGYSDGTFAPEDNLTRSQAVNVINKMQDRVPNSSMFTVSDSPFIDIINPSHWAFYDIIEAAVEHSFGLH